MRYAIVFIEFIEFANDYYGTRSIIALQNVNETDDLMSFSMSQSQSIERKKPFDRFDVMSK